MHDKSVQILGGDLGHSRFIRSLAFDPEGDYLVRVVWCLLQLG